MEKQIWLLGCEESQAVTIELRNRGIEAYSNDILPCSGGHPEWHLQMDLFEAYKLVKPTHGVFFPPCTYLTVTANSWFKDQPKRRSGVLVGAERRYARELAVEFFMRIVELPIVKAIENPIGVMSTRYRKPDQIIQPWQFGHSAQKATCLWLHGFPLLQPTNIVGKPPVIVSKSGRKDSAFHFYSVSMPKDERAKFRSTTFPGIAKAIAEQWANR